jgi:hypothetical protein
MFQRAKDKERLLVIAKEGMHIPVSNVFIPSNESPKMRKKHIMVQSAVNKILYGTYKKGGLVIILPSKSQNLYPESIIHLHIGPQRKSKIISWRSFIISSIIISIVPYILRQ